MRVSEHEELGGSWPRPGVASRCDTVVWQRRRTCTLGPPLGHGIGAAVARDLGHAGTVAATAPTVVECMSPSSETITTLTGGVLGASEPERLPIESVEDPVDPPDGGQHAGAHRMPGPAEQSSALK